MAQLIWLKNGPLTAAKQVHFDNADDLPPESARILFGREKPPTKEEALRCLIECHPEVLPWGDWNEGGDRKPRFLVLTREIPGASTDLLLLESWLNEVENETEDRFVVVECKLARNPEIQREVVGQTLEYSSRVIRGALCAAVATAATSESALFGKADEYWTRRDSAGALDREARKALGENWKNAFQKAQKRAMEGDVRLVIVSDVVPDELRTTIAFLPKEILLSAVEVTLAGDPAGAVALRSENAARAVDRKKLGDLWTRLVQEITIAPVELQLVSCGEELLVDSASLGQSSGGGRRSEMEVTKFIEKAPEGWQPIYREILQVVGDYSELATRPAQAEVEIQTRVAPSSGGGQRTLIRFKEHAKKRCYATTAYLEDLCNKKRYGLSSSQISQVRAVALDFIESLAREVGGRREKKSAGMQLIFSEQDLSTSAKRSRMLQIANDVARRVAGILP